MLPIRGYAQSWCFIVKEEFIKNRYEPGFGYYFLLFSGTNIFKPVTEAVTIIAIYPPLLPCSGAQTLTG
jgi:hypothetical protein